MTCSPLTPETPLGAVTRYFAAYNLVCGPVVDDQNHLLGAVTVDDLLDHLLPHDWRADAQELDTRCHHRSSSRRSPVSNSESRLYTPRTSRRPSLRPDPEAVGAITESIARFFGTGRYLLIQTILVLVWIALNVGAIRFRWDPYPFILLNLAFSTQAAYAAPLILLAQNRQENRDRVTLNEDRRRAAQTKADTEYLARELAALRLAVGGGPHARTPAPRTGGSAQPVGRFAAGKPGPRGQEIRLRIRSTHCATPVTRVMYGDLVHQTKKQARNKHKEATAERRVSRRLTNSRTVECA